jgi:hypothetical protein
MNSNVALSKDKRKTKTTAKKFVLISNYELTQQRKRLLKDTHVITAHFPPGGLWINVA